MNTERLTTVATELEAPPEVVRAFREVDPRAELIYIGKGKWWVGLVYEDIPLIHIGRRELENIKKQGGASWPTVRMAQLKAEGFRRVILWDIDKRTKEWRPLTRVEGEDGWGKLLERFRIQNDLYLKYPDTNEAHKRLMLADELGGMDEGLRKKIALVLEVFHAKKGEIWKRMKGRKVFTGLGGILKPGPQEE